MARPKDQHDEEASAEGDELDAASGPRRKGPPSEAVQLLVAEFRRRAKGLSGPALDAEVERLVDRLIERHVRIAPDKMQPSVRDELRAKLREDPTLSAMLTEMMAAARAE